jgi:polyisoprenoid-binding protein YceI
MENTQSKWTVDPGHSKVQFKVKHLTIANVTGILKKFSGEVQTGSDDFSQATIAFEIDTSSLDTNLAERDNHLRSNLFLDAEKFPKLVFNGALQKKADGYIANGDLTIKDVTKNIQLSVEFNGTGKDKMGNTRGGFEAHGKINRKDFGITFNMLTEAGGLVVGEEVSLLFDIELIKTTN